MPLGTIQAAHPLPHSLQTNERPIAANWGKCSQSFKTQYVKRRIYTVGAIPFLSFFLFVLLNDSISCSFFRLTEDLERMILRKFINSSEALIPKNGLIYCVKHGCVCGNGGNFMGPSRCRRELSCRGAVSNSLPPTEARGFGFQVTLGEGMQPGWVSRPYLHPARYPGEPHLLLSPGQHPRAQASSLGAFALRSRPYLRPLSVALA